MAEIVCKQKNDKWHTSSSMVDTFCVILNSHWVHHVKPSVLAHSAAFLYVPLAVERAIARFSF